MVIDMCNRKEHLCVILALFLFEQTLSIHILLPSRPVCDESLSKSVHEGVIGQSEVFPWIGLLRIHLYADEISGSGVTGIVLVKERYAIAHANDVYRIPRLVFVQNSTVMFIPTKEKPLVMQVKNYLIHPEYGVSTYNTIALIELDREAPFKPICWAYNQTFNISHKLYAVGFTDENTVFEKIFYPIKYLNPTFCRQFYKNITEPKLQPSYFHCGSAMKTKNINCVWENGMALVSNSSKKWTLLGFGLSGPDCNKPGRFIDMNKYFPWIMSATKFKRNKTSEHITTTARRTTTDGQNKTANVGRKSASKLPDTKKTTTTTKQQQQQHRRQHVGYSDVFREPYRGLWQGYKEEEDSFEVYKVDRNTYHFQRKHIGSLASCADQKKVLIYREKMRVVDSEYQKRTAEFRITIYDSNMANFTCMTVKVSNGNLDISSIQTWYRDSIDREDGGIKSYGDETPSELLKYYPLPNKYNPIEAEDEANIPYKWGGKSSHLRPQFITDTADYSRMSDMNYNILFKFDFEAEATMDLSVYGMPKFRMTTTEKPFDWMDGWRRAKPLNKDQFKPTKKNRLEKARERVADRVAIKKRDKIRMARRKKGRKSNSTERNLRIKYKFIDREAIETREKFRVAKGRKKERKLGNKYKKIQRKGGRKSAEQNVSTTTEGRNIFGFNISQQGIDNIYHYFLN